MVVGVGNVVCIGAGGILPGPRVGSGGIRGSGGCTGEPGWVQTASVLGLHRARGVRTGLR